MSVLEMSLTGSAMIALILLARALGGRRLPRRVFVVLWDLAALRLLVPWTVPFPWRLPGAPSPGAIESSGSLAFATGTATSGSVPRIAEEAAAAGMSPEDVWLAIWALGACVCAALVAVRYARWRGLFAMSVPATESAALRRWRETHPLRRPLRVRVSEFVDAPLTYGFARPVALLPQDTVRYDERTLGLILTHEWLHIRRFDSAAKLLYTAAACVHWFNPLGWVLRSRADADVELSCDEGVVARSGERGIYARMLVGIEEQRSGLAPFCSCSSTKERIRNIMRRKNRSALSALVSVLLVALVCAGCAALQPAEPASGAETVAYVTETSDVPSAIAQSADSGDQEWWTAEEYASWLETEKARLQESLGRRGRTAEGEFTWTQKKIDETIAMYESILRGIREGMLVSKNFGASGEIEEALLTGLDNPPDVSEYAAYGLEERDGKLVWNGRPVRYFEDAAELEPGAWAVRAQYYDPAGDVDARASRETTENPDGSRDPFGRLLGLEEMPAAEASQRAEDYLSGGKGAETTIAGEGLDAEEYLRRYAPFGLTWEFNEDDDAGYLRMWWNGNPVRSVLDTNKGIWIANNMRGSDLGPDAVRLETEYEGDRLTGLRVIRETASETAYAAYAEGDGTGVGFPRIFAAYAGLGLRFERDPDSEGERYNLSWDGTPVNSFVDEGPNGTFTYESARQTPDGIAIEIQYESGVPARIARR